jgi:hypothetical protein
VCHGSPWALYLCVNTYIKSIVFISLKYNHSSRAKLVSSRALLVKNEHVHSSRAKSMDCPRACHELIWERMNTLHTVNRFTLERKVRGTLKYKARGLLASSLTAHLSRSNAHLSRSNALAACRPTVHGLCCRAQIQSSRAVHRLLTSSPNARLSGSTALLASSRAARELCI